MLFYTLQSVTYMWHFGLEPKASSADLCKLMRQIDDMSSCDTVSCPYVSGVCFLCHRLRFHQIPHTDPRGLFLNMDLSGKYFLQKKLSWRETFVVDLWTQSGWHNRQCCVRMWEKPLPSKSHKFFN